MKGHVTINNLSKPENDPVNVVLSTHRLKSAKRSSLTNEFLKSSPSFVFLFTVKCKESVHSFLHFYGVNGFGQQLHCSDAGEEVICLFKS